MTALPIPTPSAPNRILGRMDDLLFYQGDLRQGLEAQERLMRQAIDDEPEKSLLQADVGQWAASLAHHFAVECPQLQPDAVWMESSKDIKIDVSHSQERYFSAYYPDEARTVPGYRVVVHVPFAGDLGVFGLKPSQFDLNPPRAHVTKKDLQLTVEFAHNATPDMAAKTQEFVAKVDKYLGFAGQQIDTFNAGLESIARQAIETRQRRVAERDAQLAASSIPIREPADDGKKTYIANVLVRRPAPSLPATRGDDRAPVLEPALDEAVFEHILRIIREQCLHLEQSPRTYKAMDEEQRRDAILAALKVDYSGFTAETDNQGGHTDILVRHEGRNLFICECKFWSGPKSLTETIDQLFGYAGWRDTKLAVVIFVREKGMTALLEKARATLAEHPQFVAWKEAAGETELRATMHWPGDEERLADLNVFFVHTPRTKTNGRT